MNLAIATLWLSLWLAGWQAEFSLAPKGTTYITRVRLEIILWRLDRIPAWRNAVAIVRGQVSAHPIYEPFILCDAEALAAWRTALQ
jgi:hypothetical protein